MNDPLLNAAGRRLNLSKDQQKTWAEHLKKQTGKTGSPEQGARYANHVTKAALHRKMRDKDKQLKGPLSG